MKICAWQRSFDLIDWDLWEGVLLPLALPAKINCSQMKIGDLRIRLRCLLLNSNGELSPLEGFSVSFRIPEGKSKMALKAKRIEKKWEEFRSTWKICITFRIPEGTSKLAQAKKNNKRKKAKKIGFYSTSQKEEKRKKEAEKRSFLLHKFIF